MSSLQTARLELRPATTASLRADLEGRDALAAALDADVPPSWPPELYDADAMHWMLGQLESTDLGAFGFYYLIVRSADGATPHSGLLIGAGGFKGLPTPQGEVEIGYSVVAEHQRRGYATEAAEAWVARAFADPRVQTVVGQTLEGLTPSIRVMERAGFVYAGKGDDEGAPEGERVIRYERRRVTG